MLFDPVSDHTKIPDDPGIFVQFQFLIYGDLGTRFTAVTFVMDPVHANEIGHDGNNMICGVSVPCLCGCLEFCEIQAFCV